MLETELELLPRLIADTAEPLPDIDDRTFGEFFDRFGDARVVLLGEASHGTSEFYRARAAISRRLIERHGFTIVAAEADWPDAATAASIRGRRTRRSTAATRCSKAMPGARSVSSRCSRTCSRSRSTASPKSVTNGSTPRPTLGSSRTPRLITE